MNIKWVDKAFRGLLLDEKEIDYKYEPKSSRDVKTIFRAIGSDDRKIKRHTHFDDLKEDFIEELTVFGFSPFTHKTFMEQLKDKDIMKYKLKQFNYGLKNYVKKAYTSPNQRSNSVLSNQKNVSLCINNNNSSNGSSSSSKGHFLYQMLNKVGKLKDEDVDYMFNKDGSKRKVNLVIESDNDGSSGVKRKEGLGRTNSVVLKKRNKNKFNCKGGYISNSNCNCNTYRSNVNIKSLLSNKRIISHSHTNSNKFVKCINTNNNNINNGIHRRNKTLFYEFKSYMQPSLQKPILFETQPHFQLNSNNNNSNSNNSNIKIPKIEKLYSITSHNEHNSPRSSSRNSTYNNNNNLSNRHSKPKTTFEANKIVFTTDANALNSNNNTHYRFLEKIEKNPESIFSKAKKISNKY